MSIRGNKPVGRTARIMMAISVGLILVAIVIGIVAIRNQRAFPTRGAASLPAQAAAAGADPGAKPAAP